MMKQNIKMMLVAGLVVSSIIPNSKANEKSLIYENRFEVTKGLAAWPRGMKVILDTDNKKSGESSILFTSDYNSTVYFYLKTKLGYKYQFNLWYKANKIPITRNGININFNKKGGGNGSAGTKALSFKNITADNQWHQFSGEFVTSADTASCQFMLNFYRTDAVINIDNLQIYEIGPATADEISNTGSETATEHKPAPTATAFSNGGFEQGKSGWTSWFKPEEADWSIDKSVKHSGEASVLISGTKPGRHFVVRKVGKLTPGSIYKISFWVKTEANMTSDKTQKGSPAVTFDFFPRNAKPRPYFELNKMRGTKPWKHYAFYAEAPAGTKGAYLCLIHDGGKIWFDDIMVEEEEE